MGGCWCSSRPFGWSKKLLKSLGRNRNKRCLEEPGGPERAFPRLGKGGLRGVNPSQGLGAADVNPALEIRVCAAMDVRFSTQSSAERLSGVPRPLRLLGRESWEGHQAGGAAGGQIPAQIRRVCPVPVSKLFRWDLWMRDRGFALLLLVSA